MGDDYHILFLAEQPASISQIPATNLSFEKCDAHPSASVPLGLALNRAIRHCQTQFIVVTRLPAEESTFRGISNQIRSLGSNLAGIVGLTGAKTYPPEHRTELAVGLDEIAIQRSSHSFREVVILFPDFLVMRRDQIIDEPFDETLTDAECLLADLCLRWHLRRGWSVRELELPPGSTKKSTAPNEVPARITTRFAGFLPLGLQGVRRWNQTVTEWAKRGDRTGLRLMNPLSVRYTRFTKEAGALVGHDGKESFEIREPTKLEIPGEPTLFVVYGFGTGETVQRLLEGPENLILVIEPEAAVIRHVLTTRDFADAIVTSLTILVPTFDPPEFLEIGILEAVVEIQSIARTCKLPVRQVVLGSHSSHRQKLLEIEHSLGISPQIAHRVQGWPTASGTNHAEVTVASPNCAIFDDLAVCLQRLGADVRLLHVPDKPREWSQTRWLHAVRTLREWGSAVTLQRNRCLLDTDNPRERRKIGDFLPGKMVSWWWDVPNVTSLIDRRDPSVNEVEGYAFACGILKVLGPGARWLPPAARMSFVEQSLETIDEQATLGSVIFVGQSRYDRLRANLNSLLNLIAVTRPKDCAELAAKVNQAKSMTALYRSLQQHTPALRVAIEEIGDPWPNHSYYLSYLLEMSETAAFRLAAIESLAGFPLLVFGDDGWIRSQAVRPENYRGLMAPSQLPQLYQQPALQLNLNFMQVSTTVNPRVLDVAAAGGVVLTDHRPEIVDLFPDETKRPFSFPTLEVLPDTVSSLLQRDLRDQRHSVADVVRSQHTMMHRACTIASNLGLMLRAPAADIGTSSS